MGVIAFKLCCKAISSLDRAILVKAKSDAIARLAINIPFFVSVVIYCNLVTRKQGAIHIAVTTQDVKEYATGRFIFKKSCFVMTIFTLAIAVSVQKAIIEFICFFFQKINLKKTHP
tara:strand:+ start:1272 stop:1619 length:348 start_codon:yes stop_codon:yes gene_type:complete